MPPAAAPAGTRSARRSCAASSALRACSASARAAAAARALARAGRLLVGFGRLRRPPRSARCSASRLGRGRFAEPHLALGIGALGVGDLDVERRRLCFELPALVLAVLARRSSACVSRCLGVRLALGAIRPARARRRQCARGPRRVSRARVAASARLSATAAAAAPADVRAAATSAPAPPDRAATQALVRRRRALRPRPATTGARSSIRWARLERWAPAVRSPRLQHRSRGWRRADRVPPPAPRGAPPRPRRGAAPSPRAPPGVQRASDRRSASRPGSAAASSARRLARISRSAAAAAARGRDKAVPAAQLARLG